GILRVGLDEQRITQRRLGDLLLARRPAEAMRWKRLLPVGRLGNLGMLANMVVGARDDANSVPVRVVRQFLQVGDELLGVRYVQLAVRLHEVVLRIHVPEDDAGRAGHECSPRKGRQPGESLRGALRVSTTPATALERQRDRHLVTGVLPRTARATRPASRRKLLLLDDFEAEP